MTLQEASRRFHLNLKTLQLFETSGLLKGNTTEAGKSDYKESDLQRASQLHFLMNAGMDLHTLKRFVSLYDAERNTSEEQVRILRKCRYQLLDEIHGKQQSLDRLDYLIYKIKNQKT